MKFINNAKIAKRVMNRVSNFFERFLALKDTDFYFYNKMKLAFISVYVKDKCNYAAKPVEFIFA